MITKTNYEIFVDTIKSLSTAQGFYSRLYRNFLESSKEEKENAKQYLNSIPQWHDTVDCVLFLEQ